MKVLFLFVICFVACASVAVVQSDIKLEIGAKLPRKYVPRKTNKLILTHPSQMRPYIEKTINKVEYIIAFDKKTREIKYIHTNDEDFRTSNGLSVDSEITIMPEQLSIFPGWEIRAPVTSDGWFPILGTDAPMLGGDFFSKLKNGESVKVEIDGFSKGGN